MVVATKSEGNKLTEYLRNFLLSSRHNLNYFIYRRKVTNKGFFQGIQNFFHNELPESENNFKLVEFVIIWRVACAPCNRTPKLIKWQMNFEQPQVFRRQLGKLFSDVSNKKNLASKNELCVPTNRKVIECPFVIVSTVYDALGQ
ncbi:hypothetical protein TNCV_1902661 [Trichonephila clavipes]|nr:hypothetical protein TNCV_1902661 [Trichonephila clavipes]